MECVTKFGGIPDYGVKNNCKYDVKDCNLCRECHKYAKVKQDQYFEKLRSIVEENNNMIKESIKLDGTIDFLNSLLTYDREGISKLFESRIECNKKLGDHPTVQVYFDKKQDKDYVGVLGLLNGLFGIADDGYGAIAMDLDDNGIITKFERIR